MEEYFNGRKDLQHRDIGPSREENVKVQTFRAQMSLCDNYPLKLQEQILPIIDLMAIRYGGFSCILRLIFCHLSNSHFKKLHDFITLQLPNGFPVKVGKNTTDDLYVTTSHWLLLSRDSTLSCINS